MTLLPVDFEGVEEKWFEVWTGLESDMGYKPPVFWWEGQCVMLLRTLIC